MASTPPPAAFSFADRYSDNRVDDRSSRAEVDHYENQRQHPSSTQTDLSHQQYRREPLPDRYNASSMKQQSSHRDIDSRSSSSAERYDHSRRDDSLDQRRHVKDQRRYVEEHQPSQQRRHSPTSHRHQQHHTTTAPVRSDDRNQPRSYPQSSRPRNESPVLGRLRHAHTGISSSSNNANAANLERNDQPRKTSSSISLDVDDDPEEIRKREERKQRFAADSATRQRGGLVGAATSTIVPQHQQHHQTGRRHDGGLLFQGSLSRQPPKGDERPHPQPPGLWTQSRNGEWYCASPITSEFRWSPPLPDTPRNANAKSVSPNQATQESSSSSAFEDEDVYDPESFHAENVGYVDPDAERERNSGRKRSVSPKDHTYTRSHIDNHNHYSHHQNQSKRIRIQTAQPPNPNPNLKINPGTGIGGISIIDSRTNDFDSRVIGEQMEPEIETEQRPAVPVSEQRSLNPVAPPLISPNETITLLPLATSPPSFSASFTAAADFRIHRVQHDPDMLAYRRIKSTLPYLTRRLVGDEVWARVEKLVAKCGGGGGTHDLKMDRIKTVNGERLEKQSEEQMQMVIQIDTALKNMLAAKKDAMSWRR